MHDYDTLHQLVDHFPLSPGVYQMKNAKGTILYIGKAKALRTRVKSYLRTQNSGKVAVLMSHVRHIDYIVTQNEYDALLLEHNLIKEHKPKYNILLRDDKTFPMLKITHEEYPRVVKTRKIDTKQAEYFGPFMDVHLINKYLEFIEKHFALRKCKKIKPRNHPCLYYHLGRCTAVCSGYITKKDYLSKVKKIRSLLQGNTKTLKKDLTVQMHAHAHRLEYEKARQCRDSISALELIETRQNIIDYQDGVRHYIGVMDQHNKCCVVVVHMKEGKMVDQHIAHLNTFDSIIDTLEQFLIHYYQNTSLHPDFIFTPIKLNKEIIQYFKNQHTVLQTPEHRKDMTIINFAKENARYGLNQHMQQQDHSDMLSILQSTLSLKELPTRIEGFDIATVQGMHTSAAIVSFYNGHPDKTQYRHFTIKSLQPGEMNDFQAIAETVSRRYTRLKNEGLPLPNLIVIDGGIGQVNSAKAVLDALELDIPLIGLAKKHEEIYFPGTLSATPYAPNIPSNPLQIPRDDPASKLLQAIRNEAHRFATRFRAGKQKKAMTNYP